MMTLRRFASGVESVPTATAWYLADLGEALGKQELFTRQSPQRLKVLRENAMIESAVSSNRIERRNGKEPTDGNWVIPSELGSELGNKRSNVVKNVVVNGPDYGKPRNE